MEMDCDEYYEFLQLCKSRRPLDETKKCLECRISRSIREREWDERIKCFKCCYYIPPRWDETKYRKTKEIGKDGVCIIFELAKNNNHYILAQVLNFIRYADVFNENNETPLNIVCQNIQDGFSQETARLLVSFGADIFWRDCNEITPAAYFFKSENPLLIDEVFRRLDYIERGLDNYDNTALHLSVEIDSLEYINECIRRGADPNLRNNLGFAPVHKAIISPNLVLLSYIKERGGDIDRLGPFNMNSLHLAVMMQDSDAISTVFFCEPDLEMRDMRGYTPLMNMITNCNYIVDQIILLLEEGADPTSFSPQGYNCLHLLIREGNIENRPQRLPYLIRVLLQYDVHIESLTRYKATPLMVAFECNRPEAAFHLLRYGAYMKTLFNYMTIADRLLLKDEVFESSSWEAQLFEVFLLFISLEEDDLFEYIGKSHQKHRISFAEEKILKYREELESLKTVLVPETNISYYNILKMSLHSLASHTADTVTLSDLDGLFLSPSLKLFRKLMIYKLEDAFRFYAARVNVSEYVQESINEEFPWIDVPIGVAEHIVSFLDFHNVLKVDRELSDEYEIEWEDYP